MSIQWYYDTKDVQWDELSHLYKIAPLGDKPPESLELVFNNSRYTCFALDKGELIGAGRALADGADCSYICDVAVHPQYQGQGLGQIIVKKLVSLSRGHKKILLYAYPGKEAFYEKLGFKRMTTAMAIFDNQAQALDIGLLEDNSE